MIKKLVLILSAMALAVGCMTGCSGTEAETTPKPSPSQTAAANEEIDPAKLENTVPFTITLTDGRVMKGVLYPDVAPATVENFIKLCDEGFYTGLIFHRVIPGFMIQGGGYDENMTQKEADPIKGEFTQNGFENDLKHTRGVLSMARTNVPDSASSQFFIMHDDAPHLDGQYAAFGKITEGLEVLDEIANTETVKTQYSEAQPVTPVVIQSITIDR